jgi:hypothetical protein
LFLPAAGPQVAQRPAGGHGRQRPNAFLQSDHGAWWLLRRSF